MCVISVEKKRISQFMKAVDNIYTPGDKCRARLESLLYYKKLTKNEYFSRENQFPKEFGFICSGILRMFYLSENGEEWNKHFFTENNFIAASIGPDKKSISNIQALTAVTLLCISYPEFVELLNEFEQFNVFLRKVIINYLDQKQEKEIRFLSDTTVNNYKYFIGKYPDLENTISHYHIASYLGITPTQLSRIRKKLKE